MVQGKSKGLQKKMVSGHSANKAQQVKKGRRDIPPKKAAAIKHVSMQKSLSAKINRSIEQHAVAAASSGKLTIMKHDDAVSSTAHKKAKNGKT